VLDRRRYERATFLRRLVLEVSGDERRIEASSLDISLGGVGILSPVGVPRGQRVTVAFWLKNGGGETVIERVDGTVMGARSEVDGCRLGIEFTHPLRAELQPLLVAKIESL
jgi:c-di-GMP-binding flagellar brake protein YcgR